MNSCAYTGMVRHKRLRPVEHEFRYRVAMLYLDLDELDSVFARHLLWSARRPAYARFRRRDYPGDVSQPLDQWVRDLVKRRTGERPEGRVCLLTAPRMAGRWFNPISVYYCWNRTGGLDWVVAEVTSTPWRERTHHVLDARGVHRVAFGEFAKDMHVSPFLPMDMSYRWRLVAPGPGLGLVIDVLREGEVVLETSLALRRRPLSTAWLARLLVTYPPMSWRVLTGIYRQALSLWRRGVAYHPHPRRGAAQEDRTAA
ncbi:MAG: DUF1365 domain-containing protein [Candidatus Dormibacteria bacterium]